MINIQKKVDCCGCNACGDICSKKAISFKTDNEGFWYPEVDMEKCVDCELCKKVCPILKVDSLKKNDFEQPHCYAVQNKNLDSLFNSTSGSAFAAFAEKIYKEGGYVGGAVFDDNYSVKQFISSDKKDLEKLRNSKYVQSNSEGFYLSVQELLKAGEKVLVCGLPCQMFALKAFLRKDYDNLIMVDLICLGINSPRILKAYLNYKEEQHESKIVYYKAKNKELGWRELTTKLVFENGDVEYDKKDTNYFTIGFIGTHAYSRPSCYECKFKGFPRISDITIGDFWGAEKYVGKDLDHDLGTSIVLVNSHKGETFFNEVQSKFKFKEVPFENVLPGNRALIQPIPKPTFDRSEFYEDLSKLPYKDFVNKYIKIPSRNFSLKNKIKNILRFIVNVRRASGINIKTWWQNIYFNIICRQFHTHITHGKFILIHKHCIFDIAKTANVTISGVLSFGVKTIKGSKLESRLYVASGGVLEAKGGVICYGADIELFQDSHLELGKGISFNINTTIICGDHIQIADDVCFGRNVTVRDNSGEHFISRKVYKNKRPVIIGQHSWITEQSMVMPGSKIGVGVIVGARSVVSGKLPNFTMVTGTPAQVVDEEIYWKA